MSWEPRQLARSLPGASTIATRCRASPLITPVEAVAFWTAVCLPAVYVPLLFIGERSAVATLLAVHAIALALGHPYNRQQEESS